MAETDAAIVCHRICHCHQDLFRLVAADVLRVVVVDDRLILELKTVEKILPIHEAQLLTYLKLSGIRTGLLLNFYTTLLKDGIKRMVLS